MFRHCDIRPGEPSCIYAAQVRRYRLSTTQSANPVNTDNGASLHYVK